MKSALLVAATLATFSSFPVIAQQTPDQAPQQQTAPAPDAQQAPPADSQQQAPPPDSTSAPSRPAADSSSDQQGQAGQAGQGQAGQQEQASPAANDSAAASAVEMSSVKGELVGKLDTASAKTGDSVVLKTKESVKTADGTEIPKGSKLMGHVTQVQPHGEGKSNSQIALQFDHAELKGGQNVAIQSAIQSVAPSTGDASPSSVGNSPSMPSTPGGAPSGGANGSMPNSRSTEPATANSGSYQPGASGSSAGSTSNSGLAAGTVVQRNGNIAISTTAIPGVLLANNAPGQHDPRMASASGILLGAGRDVHLDGGTTIVVAVAAAPAAAGTAGGSSNR